MSAATDERTTERKAFVEAIAAEPLLAPPALLANDVPMPFEALRRRLGDAVGRRMLPKETTMPAALTFGEVLDAADALPLEEQEELAAVLARRIAAARRRRLLREVAEAEEDFRQGRCPVMTAEEIVAEALK